MKVQKIFRFLSRRPEPASASLRLAVRAAIEAVEDRDHLPLIAAARVAARIEERERRVAKNSKLSPSEFRFRGAGYSPPTRSGEGRASA